MDPKDLSGLPAKTLSPSDYLKETWQSLVKSVWPLLIRDILDGEGPGFTGIPSPQGEGPQPEAGGKPSPSPGRGDVPGQGARREKTAKERKAGREKREHEARLARLGELVKTREGERASRGERWPTEEAPEMPSPKPEGPGPDAEVIPFQKKAPRKGKRGRRPHPYFLARLRWGEARPSEFKLIRVVYREAKVMEYGDLKHYMGTKQGKSLFYLLGNKHLARITGLSHATVERGLARLRIKAHPDGSGAGAPSGSEDRKARHLEMLYLRKQGWKGEGYSIFELPFTPKHLKALKVEVWKRTRWPPKA